MIHNLLDMWLEPMSHAIKAADEGVPFVELEDMLKGLPLYPLFPGAFFAPVLSPEGVDYFLGLAESAKESFTQNPEEELKSQIPELILERHAPRAFAVAKSLFSEALCPLWAVGRGQMPTVPWVQLACYPVGHQTQFHHDKESPFTTVIYLKSGPDGGTALLPDGPLGPAFVVPPLQPGWGLFFNGAYMLHRGLPSEHERSLLVYWCK